jgi:hypothetical protein
MKYYLKAFLLTAILSVITYFIHTSVVTEPAISIFKTYLFLGLATFITVSVLKFVTLVSAKNLGVVFLGLVMMKFGAIILFFPELIDDKLELTTRDLLGFLGPYFIFLFAEMIIVLKWLNDN